MPKMILNVSKEHINLFRSLLDDMDDDSSELFGVMVESFAMGVLLKEKLKSDDLFVNMSFGKHEKEDGAHSIESVYNKKPDFAELPGNFFKQIKITKQMFRNLEILYNTKQIRMDYFFIELNNYYDVSPEEFYRLLKNLKSESVIFEISEQVYQLV
ncbi:MAG: hypothetical protein KAJ54_01855 [Candidatus Aenigmarchaeota archaeon]|nr:hypothetical protein [Candidatus Aenigmarchaeota archaeon]MCK5321672.1 hypothetical protein [Candidatus Aenigmarchaeota archaeon]